ncbi:MAG TPA: helix-turn-helix transcriptional regulator [Polyangia bacterium]|nr:helix-turn-helix transcriptional regulator [Polyangia bacterium]
MTIEARRARFARWLRERRHMRDLTARDVAVHLGVHVTTIYNAERAVPVQTPRFELLDRWLTLLGVDFLDLIGAVE